MNTFQLKIISPDKKVFEGEVYSLNVPAEDGRLGVLAFHAPLLTLLAKGELRADCKDREALALQINSGFLKVENNLAEIFI